MPAAGYSSQAGHILVINQPTQGTIAPTLTTAGIAVRLRSGSLGPDRDLLIPDPEIGGNRDIPDAYLGAVKFSGDYEMYVRVNSFMSFLWAALGTKAAPTTTGGVTTQTFTPSDGAVLPYMSIEEQVGAVGLECFNYVDAVVNTLHLEAEANGYLMATAGMIAAGQTAGITPTDVTSKYDTTSLIVGTNITVTYNGVSIAAKTFSIDINNNFQDDDFRLGSLFLGSLVPKRREVTANVTIRQQDSTLWRQAVYGSSTATVAGGLSTKQALVITVSTYDAIPASTPTTAYSLQFTIPKAILTPYGFGPNADDIIEPSIDIQAVRPAPGTPILTVVGKSDLAVVV